MKKAKKIIWVERLGLIETGILFIKSLFLDVVVRYDEYRITTISRRVLNFSPKKIFKNFCPARLTLNKKDSNGYALEYKMEKNLDFCLDNFCKRYILNEPDWFNKMTKSYIASFLSSRIRFIMMVEARAEKLKDLNHEFIIKWHPANLLIIKFYQKREFKIKQSFSVREYLKMIIKPLYLLLMILRSKIAREKSITNIEKIRPAVWMEYCVGECLERERKTSLAFWQDYVNPIDYDLVYYMDRNDSPVSNEALNICKQYGFKWVDCHKNWSLARINFKDINEILSKFIKFKCKQPIWFHFFQLEILILFKLYYSVYKRFQVKILIQHLELNWIQGIQARAIEYAGGIMLGFHWSNFPFCEEPQHLTPQHVYFVWGKMAFDWVQKKGNTCRYILPSGLWITGDDQRQRPEQLNDFTDKLEFIVSIFDSSVSYNTFQSPDTLSQFYLAVLKLIENNPLWGGIIKPKNTLDMIKALPYGKQIISLIESLIGKKRLVLFSNRISPVTAASYADLSVCYGLNSAGIVSAVHGYKAIHWDCAGWLKHPIYKDTNQKILYLYFNEFKKAIVKASQGDQTIGDFSAWRQRFNYFEDFEAPKRVGKFIQNFMDQVKKTDDEVYLLNLAVKNYFYENKVEDSFYKK